MSNSEKSILVVDDDATILAACADSLMIDGYQVDIAESGEKALQMIPKKHYDMVVTDLMMLEVDGLGVLQAAKKNSPQTEVILLTAYGRVDSAVEAMRLGAYDYLTKPFDPHKLDVSIKRAFEHQTLLRELSGLKEILRLYDATKTLSTIRDQQELLETLAKFAAEITNSSGVSIMTVSPDGKELVVTATHGTRHGILLGKSIPLNRERVSRLNSDALKTLDSLDVRKYFQMESVPGFSDITSSLSIPIFFKDRLEAIMNLSRTGAENLPFREDELRLITIFTAQAGYAIENSRLMESLQTKSKQDVFSWLLETCQKIQSLPAAQSLPPSEKEKIEATIEQCRHALGKS
ncbi:MAG TPA: response regulator [Elusimicrobiota bacterium]|nr:response regulator [Elusimicrobiota bacterium]